MNGFLSMLSARHAEDYLDKTGNYNRGSEAAYSVRTVMNGIGAAMFQGMIRQKKVLIVDDDTGCRELLVMIAEKLGYSALQAADGIEALDQASQRQPDLILMDLLMPRMSGDEATALLKAKLPTKNIPIVICTALSQGPQTTAALNAGAEEILQKPIGMSVIRGALQRYAPTAA